MKSEGDAAVTVLVETLCSIYTNEGYYALADALFYEDLADNLYEKDAAYVQRVITLASEYGLLTPRSSGNMACWLQPIFSASFFSQPSVATFRW